MYIDKLLQICTSQDLGGVSNTTTLGENSVDLGAAKNVAKGKPLYVVITIEEAFTVGTSVDFQVITDSVGTLASTPTVHGTTGAILEASLTLDREPIVLPISNLLGVKEQYIGIQMVTVGTHTTGIFSAHIAFDTP